MYSGTRVCAVSKHIHYDLYDLIDPRVMSYLNLFVVLILVLSWIGMRLKYLQHYYVSIANGRVQFIHTKELL